MRLPLWRKDTKGLPIFVDGIWAEGSFVSSAAFEEEVRRVGMAWIFGLGAAALVLGTFRDLANGGYSVTPGTDVVRVSVDVTRGTSHVYYYRGKVRWMYRRADKNYLVAL